MTDAGAPAAIPAAGESVSDTPGDPRRLPARTSRLARVAAWLPDGLVDAAWLWLMLRVALGLIAWLLVIRGSAPGPCNSDLVINGWKTFPPLADHGIAFPLVGVWQHWDACWYSKIATYGYEPGVSGTTFFPLLPFLMSGVAVLTGGSVALAGIVVNAIAFVVALTGLYQLVRNDTDGPTAQRAVLYLAVFPAAFFYLAPFTEALFLAGAVWSIAGARGGRWDVAAIGGLVAGLSRPQGLLLVLPLGWEAARALYRRWQAREHEGRRVRLTDLGPVIATLTPAAAYGAFVAYTIIVVGRSYFDAHLTWATTAIQMPWDVANAAIAYSFSHHDPIPLLGVVGFTLFAILALAGLRRVPLSYTLYTLPQLAIMLTQQNVWPLMSTVRYLAVLFPCFVVLALAGRHERLHTGWLVISLSLLGLLSALFVQGSFVG
ncbi:MAG TPA: hypothetical protein VIR16_01585 [Candidatus Limnocylindrales bacterium]